MRVTEAKRFPAMHSLAQLPLKPLNELLCVENPLSRTSDLIIEGFCFFRAPILD